ncbi:MAG: hypothetical protein M9934_13240 [Thermomicrobiales bacterium]|nr:hypothetical protein [Thermomicrobiales bacterium]
MAQPKPRVKSTGELISSSIRTRLWVLFVIVALKLLVLVQLLFFRDVSWWWVIAGVVPGLIIGKAADRMYLHSWDRSQGAVVARMDKLGTFVLVMYLLYLIFRNDIVEAGFGRGDIASVVVTSLAATVILMRIHLTFEGIKNVLREAGILDGDNSA